MRRRRRFIYILTIPAAVWMDACALFPMVLTLYLLGLSSLSPYSLGASLIGMYLFGALCRRLLKRRNRMLSVLISLPACLGLGIYLIGGSPVLFVFIPLTFAAACRGIFIAERPFNYSFSGVYLYISLFIYFVSYYLYGKIIAVQQYQGYILTAGLIAVPFFLIAINSQNLLQASGEDLRESSSMPVVRRNNRILVFVTVLAGILIAGYNTLKDALLTFLKSAVLSVMALIDRLFSMLYSPSPAGETPQGGMPPQLPAVEARPHSPFWEKVTEIMAYAVLLILSAFALFFLAKQLVKLWRRLAAWLKKLMEDGRWAGEHAGYSDEKESLIDWQIIKQSYVDGIREWLDKVRRSEPRWNKLTDNSQRVRYLYRHLILRAMESGYFFRPWRTPNETMDDLTKKGLLGEDARELLEGLYGKARYTDKAVEDSEVEILRSKLRNQ
jgi:hypothetical protein